jgi:hypothetical protein
LPTQRFDGRNLEAALARASAEVGSDARVVSAERVRSGGLGGFFTRERVEIEVELDDDDVVVAEVVEPPTSLLDLADRVSSAETLEAEARAGTAGARADATGGATAGTAGATTAGAGGRRRPGTSAVGAIGRHAVRREALPPGPPVVRPDGIDTRAGHAEARTARDDATAIDIPPAVVQVGAAPAAPRPQVSTETSTFAEILERITAETAGAGDAPAAHAHGDVAAATAPAAAAAPAAANGSTAEKAAPTNGSAANVPTATNGAATTMPARPPVQLVVRPAPPAFRAGEESGPLARLGLPPELEPAGPDLGDALVAQLAALPQPPPLPASRGTVIAVVGPPGLAYQTARTIRGQIGTDLPITTFSRRVPGDANVDEVRDQRRAWRRRPGPTVTVVDAPIGRPVDWAADALCALEPTSVWGIVEAARKTEDIAAWSTGLGGIDALCLTGLDETVSPAAPLRTGIPVALLDGQEATAERWAEVLLERLSMGTGDPTATEAACSGR